MYNNRLILVCKSDLSYNGKDSVIQMTEIRFSDLQKAKDGSRYEGNYLFARISEKSARKIEHVNFSEWYNKKIADKYNFPLNWQGNRYIVEQIRPTL